jgi:hypothetical protein
MHNPQQEEQMPMRAGTDPTLLDIEAVIVGYYHISVHDLCGPRRERELTEPRHVLFWLAKTLTRHSNCDVGRWFERDPSSVCFGRQNIDARVKSDPQLAKRLRDLTMLIWEEARVGKLEVNHAPDSSQQGNENPEHNNGPDKHDNQDIDDAHEGLSHVLSDNRLEQTPDPVDEPGNQQGDDKLDDEVHHVVALQGSTP